MTMFIILVLGLCAVIVMIWHAFVAIAWAIVFVLPKPISREEKIEAIPGLKERIAGNVMAAYLAVNRDATPKEEQVIALRNKLAQLAKNEQKAQYWMMVNELSSNYVTQLFPKVLPSNDTLPNWAKLAAR